MKCPTCKNHDHISIDLHSGGFAEGIRECSICGTICSVNHGLVKIVKDAQKCSFLQSISESVETGEYDFAAI